MLTNTDMTMAMQRYLNNAVAFMRRKGYILPTLVVLNKGVPLLIEVSHEGVFEVASNISEEDIDSPDSDEIYEYGISFKLNKDFSDDYLYEVSKEIAERYKPDAIGAISACLLRDFDDNNLPDVKDIQEDPGAYRIFFMSYFTKDSAEDNYLITPYIKKKNKMSSVEWDENDESFSITTMPGSWNMGLDDIGLLMPNPYKSEDNDEQLK